MNNDSPTSKDDLSIRGDKSSSSFVLPVVEGLDIVDGVKRLANRWDFYERMVSRFCFENRDLINKVRLEIKAGNRETALRMLHSLKGIVGTMSATALYTTAIQAEQAYKADSPEIEELLLTLENQLSDLLVKVADSECFSFR